MARALPDFLIIGAPKSGTTSLYHYLAQHPQVFMSPNKEPHFFAFEGSPPAFEGPGDDRAWLNTSSVSELSEYQALFTKATAQQKCGEASTMHLYLENSHRNIAYHQPSTKLIAILRHPLDRAYSHYAHLRREGREWETDFRRALEQESERIRKNWSPAWHYRSVGQYHKQLKPYLQTFDFEQLRIYLFDDFVRTPQKIYREIFEFIGVEADVEIDTSTRHNTTSTFRKNRLVHHFLTESNGLKTALKQIIPAHIRKPLSAKAYRKNVASSQPLTAALRDHLLPSFEPDILKLQDLLERDLSCWLHPSEK